jgi:penicillin G amidase
MNRLQTWITPVVSAGLLLFGRTCLPQKRGRRRFTGIHKTVEIHRDQWGIPHIYSQDLHDLFFGQGYVHAQDRLFQMDFQRRLVSGRLSEVIGAATVPLDRWVRILSMRRTAEKEATLKKTLLTIETLQALEAYCAGVNAFIQNDKLPLEFKLLGYRPEAWELADILAWVKMMSWNLSVNWETELLRARFIATLGPEKARELEPEDFDSGPTIIPHGIDFSRLGESALKDAEKLRTLNGPSPLDGIGSNNWVISGSRTTTGSPILANDMHLMMSIPSIWYENHLNCGEVNITGVTFPGIPGVVAGRNQNVAWGFTNGFADVQDLFIERIRRGEDGKVFYEYEGEWLEADVYQEEIQVKGGKPLTEEVIVTRHGPIINSLAPGISGDAPLALKWTSLEPDGMINAVASILVAKNCQDLRRAFEHWTAPVQNVVCADREGNIAYIYPGKVPIRRNGDGRVPVPGWTGEHEWEGYIPYEDLPFLFNPPSGYIVTANNRVAQENYPYFIGHEYILGDRARRITEIIESQEKIGIDDIKAMHFDLISPSARLVAQYLGFLQPEQPELQQIVKRMGAWDGNMGASSSEAAIYQVFIRRMLTLLLENKMGNNTLHYMGKGITPILSEVSLFSNRSLEWLLETLGEKDSKWYDLGSGETREQVSIRALQESVSYLKEQLGPDWENWEWGNLHSLYLVHNLGRVKILEKVFNRGPFPLGGDYNTIWATGSSFHDLNSNQVVSAPFRFIADLADPKNSWGLLAPGQSGSPADPHYDDQLTGWFTKEYHPMYFDLETVEKNSHYRLILVPE